MNKKIFLAIALVVIIVVIFLLFIFKKENKIEVYNETIPSNFALAENSFSKVKYPSEWSWTLHRDNERIKFSNPENTVEFSINKDSSLPPLNSSSLEQRKKNHISVYENIGEAATKNTSPNVTYDRDVKIINVSNIEVNNVRGYQILHSAVSGTDNKPYKAFFMELEKDDKFYQVYINIDADKYDNLIEIIRQIISSIEII